MTSLRKAAGYVSRNVGDETIVVPVRAGIGDLESIFTMNAVGAAIWNAIDGEATVAALARALAQTFDVGETEAAEDVAAFVELLTSKGLLAPATAAVGMGPT